MNSGREKVDYVIKFFSILRHFTGRHAGKSFALQPWRLVVIASIYRFYVKETNERLVKYVYIEISRKNGKTAFAAGLCLFHLIADGEMDTEGRFGCKLKRSGKDCFQVFVLSLLKGLIKREGIWYHSGIR